MAAVHPLTDQLENLRTRIRSATLRPEVAVVRELLQELQEQKRPLAAAQARAAQWVKIARADTRARPYLDTLLEQAPLDSVPGKAMMSLAEALLRTPDVKRADQLVSERISAIREARESQGERNENGSLLGRVAFGLLGFAARLLPDVEKQLQGERQLTAVTGAVAAPITRAALHQAMRLLGKAFIAGEIIEGALAQGATDAQLALCSYDMLGEGARTDADAQRYFEAYAHAIEALSKQPNLSESLHQRSGISVKLSALEPRYSLLQRQRVFEHLVPQILKLTRAAARANIGLTIDAEEADRLDLSLDIMEALARDPETKNWPGLGFAVQAYGRRAPWVIEWAAALSRQSGRRMTLRLVKGAYWDAEIKRAQERGLQSFPVFTCKAATDVSYLACAQRLLAAQDCIYPQFATHNAFTIAAVLEMALPDAQYEFQRLHGMGELLYRTARSSTPQFPPVRVYAPVGTHEDLLPYLVRRLLENGANSSFVHQFLNSQAPVEEVVSNPVTLILQAPQMTQPSASLSRIREPAALYAPERSNSPGMDFGNPAELATLQASLTQLRATVWRGGPILDGRPTMDASATDPSTAVRSPANLEELVGYSRDATAQEIEQALRSAAKAQLSWDAVGAEQRAACLEKAASLLEERHQQFLSLLVREAGKTLPDAVAELRETVDFCRYYAVRGREQFGAPLELRGPTGEKNLLSLHGRGVFACISPWNFPLAIFAGQITAALMAGNSVIAKPAPSTALVAFEMVKLLHEAGVPGEVLQLTPMADGPKFSELALRHPAIAGVAFTGSTATATAINRTLANRNGPLVPLIAETGGVNAMIVDATALTEQVVDDAVTSAFTSAGQRCSALRVLYLQDEIAERVIQMLMGAMQTLVIGDPAEPATDVGPVISAQALQRLQQHAERMKKEATLLYACQLPAQLTGGAAKPSINGYFFAPHLFELKALDQLKTEEFGPILHVARYKAEQLPQVLEAIRNTGFGLTLGVHSRLESVANHVFQNVQTGNTYINRNMIGAVVGVQPFGGCGLSGTGPKAGGPHYLQRFATERTLTINTVAMGGNTDLLAGIGEG